jgi:hypothetical protein
MTFLEKAVGEPAVDRDGLSGDGMRIWLYDGTKYSGQDPMQRRKMYQLTFR